MPKSLKNLLSTPYPYLFLATYYCVWVNWANFKLPFWNPHEVISRLPQLHYNPTNNIIRLLAAVFLPPLVCWLYWLLVDRGVWEKLYAVKWRRTVIWIGFAGLSILLAASIGFLQGRNDPAFSAGAYGGPYSNALVDTFHEGETLGPAVNYSQPDQKPYEDFVFFHGVFQDPGRSNLAFKLFGRSIGATRVLTTILFTLTYVFLLGFLFILFKGNAVKIGLSIAAVGILTLPASFTGEMSKYILGVQFPYRDIATILFLTCAVVGFRSLASRQRLHGAMSAAIGFIAFAGFANSIDRALYIGALSVAWLVMLWLITPTKLFIRQTAAWYAGGAALGTIVLGAALKWAYIPFITYTLGMGSYKEYLDGQVFTQPTKEINLVLMLISAAVTVVGAWLVYARTNQKTFLKRSPGFVKSWHKAASVTVERHFITILLVGTAFVFLRSAIGRAEIAHFAYSAQWIYILVLYAGFTYGDAYIKRYARALTMIAVLLIGAIGLNYVGAIARLNIKSEILPLSISDKELVRTDYWETAQYLKNNLTGDETFMTMTSEAVWYYLVDKPSPVKYPVVWFAATPEQRQTLADQIEDNKNIKFILTNSNWTSNFDFVSYDTRLPEAFKIMQRDYEPYKGIGQQTLWIRKSYLATNNN